MIQPEFLKEGFFSVRSFERSHFEGQRGGSLLPRNRCRNWDRKALVTDHRDKITASGAGNNNKKRELSSRKLSRLYRTFNLPVKSPFKRRSCSMKFVVCSNRGALISFHFISPPPLG